MGVDALSTLRYSAAGSGGGIGQRVPVLGEILSPLQMVGGIVMLAALVVFQLKR